MRLFRFTPLIPSLFALVLSTGAATVFAAECTPTPDGLSYQAPYTSPIGLPRCSGTIGRWNVCEVCQLSNATKTASQAYTESYPPSGTGLQPVATFTQGATTLTVNGFFDGLTLDNHAVFRIRFAPTTNSGTWNFSATSTDSGLAFTTRSFTAGTSTSKGFLRRHSASPERFIYDNGTTRLFMWGQTYYQLIDNARAGTTWKTAVDQNAARSISKIRMLLYPWWGYYSGFPDSQPFQGSATSPDHDLLDLTHWQKFDEVVDYMNKKPMLAELIVFKDPGTTKDPMNNCNTVVLDNCRTFGVNQDQDKRYARYTLARFGAFPNVIWSLANEYGAIDDTTACTATRSWLSDLTTYFNTMGSLFRNEDPWNTGSANPRALTLHEQNTTPLWDFISATWPVHASLQFGTSTSSCSICGTNVCASSFGDDFGNFSIVRNIFQSCTTNTKYNLPVVNDEYGYVGKIANAPKHRRAAWGIAVGGGYGSEGDTFNADGTLPPACQPGVPTTPGNSVLLYGTWRDAGAYYTDIQRMVNYITGIANWFRMSADNNVVSGLTGTHMSTNRKYAMSQPGVQYLVYAAAGGTVTLNLPAPSGTNYAVFQWDPRNGGAETSLGTVGSGVQNITLPDSVNDWVLHLKAQ